MKKIYLFCVTVLVYFLVSCFLVGAATILSDKQIEEISTVAEAGGDAAAQAAEAVLARVTADSVARGVSGEELISKTNLTIQEIVSGLSTDAPHFERLVNSIVTGASSGAVLGVNQAVDADPTLDAGMLTTAVVNGAVRAALFIQANNPMLDVEQLTISVNTGVAGQGGVPVEPETVEPAVMPTGQKIPPPLSPQVEVEEPPIHDDRAGSPV